jgi:hypothetical protein
VPLAGWLELQEGDACSVGLGRSQPPVPLVPSCTRPSTTSCSSSAWCAARQCWCAQLAGVTALCRLPYSSPAAGLHHIGLTVNPSKCEVVVFAKNCRAWTGFGDWKVKDKALPRSRKFKQYLGVELHDVTGTKDSVEHRLSCMIAAHSAVSRRLNDMRCPKDPVLMADLFDTITAAAGSYGCEVWSTPFLAGWHLPDCTLQTEVPGYSVQASSEVAP